MRHGGNAPFREFMENYGPEGGYVKKQSIAEKYKTWAAAQYREKVRRGIRSSSAAG
jgi:ADP-ribosylation factor GTPase-activating protein 1